MPAEAKAAARPLEISPALRDGYEVHKAALRRGLDTQLLPRQVLLATRPDTTSDEVSFVHGIPESSSLAAVTFAQDKRMRRALLVDAGLPIPKGGAYTIGRGLESAKRLVRRIGFPVVVKPAMGDNTIEVQDWVTNDGELEAAIDYFRTPSTDRPAHIRAAYALTETRDLGELDGRVVSPPGYRFLVEQHVSGEYLRFLVVGNRVRSVLLCPGGSWGGPDALPCDVTDDTHGSLRDLALDAARAIPGLAVAAVDLVASGGHKVARVQQETWIVELSERPWLTAQASISDDLSWRLADEILSEHADEMSVSLREPTREVAVDLHVEGIADPRSAQAAVNYVAAERGISGGIAMTDPVEGIAGGSFTGDPAGIAWIAEMVLDGQLGERAMLVTARHQAKGDDE